MTKPGPAKPAGTSFSAAQIGADVVAGASVALVLIPQSMAYAELAGLPPWHGLYAAAAAPILAAPFVSSRHLQTGPVALTCLLTAGALAGTAAAGTPEYVGLAALLALIVGAARLIIGLMRWGGVAWLMSEPVLRGFTLGAALLIVSSQLPAALGASSDAATVLSRAVDLVVSPGQWTLGAVALSVATVVLMRAGPRIHRMFPGVLVAATLGLAASMAGLAVGPTLGDIPSGLPSINLALPWDALPSLLVSGVVIALVGFAEAASIARIFAAEDREGWDPDREFVSQGVANLAAGLFSGFPVGGSFSRSLLGRLAGAKTPLAGFVTGLVVLAALPAASALSPLPRAILGATVIGAVVKLLDPRPLHAIWLKSRLQALIAATTLVATLAFAPHVEYGVVSGVVLALVVHLWREARVLVPVQSRGEELRLRPTGVLWFATAASLQQQVISALAAHPRTRVLIIDLSGLGRIDYSGAQVLEHLAQDLSCEDLIVQLRVIPPQAQRIVGSICNKEFTGEAAAS